MVKAKRSWKPTAAGCRIALPESTRELEVVRRQRSTQRHARQRNHWALASIVGYTNAGKSTLLNTLTGADVLAENKLFATLDPTTRRLRLPTNQNVLLTDTVGFIRKLPHGLVEAFKATLEEVVQADLLLHVVDVSHPQAEEQFNAVDAVLKEIGADGKPTLMVFNKMDQLNGNRDVAHAFYGTASQCGGHLRHKGRRHCRFAGGTGQPIAAHSRVHGTLRFRTTDLRSSPACTRLAQVIERRYSGRTARLKARIPPHLHEEFAPFIVRELQTGLAFPITNCRLLRIAVTRLITALERFAQEHGIIRRTGLVVANQDYIA